MLGFPLEKFKFRIALIVLNFALWSVQKTHAILSINQMQNKKQLRLIARVFPRFRQFACVQFDISFSN